MRKYRSRKKRYRELAVRSYVIAATIGIGLVIITALGIRYYVSQMQPPAQETAADKDAYIKAFEKREKYVIDRLKEISKNNEQFRKQMEAEAEASIAATDSQNLKDHISYLKGFLSRCYDKQRLCFFRNNETVPIGKALCVPMDGILIYMVDPEFTSDLEAAADNTISFYVKRKAPRPEELDHPANLLVYNNAMQYIYEFFKGSISRRELDEAISEIMQSKDPEYELRKNFRGREYIFRYDDMQGGTINIDFKID